MIFRGTYKVITSTLWALVAIVVFVSNDVAAWNARYFQFNETCFIDSDRLYTSIWNKDWERYYYPLYQTPSDFVPSNFMSPTLRDCRRLCELDRFPFVSVADCKKECNARNVESCGGRNSQNCLKDRGPPSIVVPVFKAHNWIVNYAVWKLKQYGLWFNSVSDEEIKYIHYGINFADHPWMGRPDAPRAHEDYVIGIYDLERENLRGSVFNRDDFMGERYLVETRFRGGTSTKPGLKYRPNLYLSACYKAKPVGQDKTIAADVLFHFPNKDAAKYTERAVLVRSIRGFDKDRVFEKSDVSAMIYGSVLYQLARKFWPNNSSCEPDLYDLPRIYSHKGPGSPETGAIVIDHFFGPGKYVERAYLPSTYLGGNPFICSPPESNIEPTEWRRDICRWGKPTWPIWVPDQQQFTPNLTSDCFATNCKKTLSRRCLKNPSCVEEYHDVLKSRYPGKSKRAALIYLGWALHMIQDLSMPQHAANWVGTVHANIETLADRIIQLGYGARSLKNGGWADWSPFEQTTDRLFGGSNSREEICDNLGLNQGFLWNAKKLKALFDQVRDEAYKDRNLINRKKSGKRNQRKKYIQIAFQRAILASMKLIACLETEPNKE
ncbi:MAG: hypothetical protein GY847_14740 [Proteobacteria bacterium]|nr:hypothetical protein [Pseudomonadota bacterium]